MTDIRFENGSYVVTSDGIPCARILPAGGAEDRFVKLEDGAWKIHNWIDTDVYPFGALFNWMQSVYDGETDDEEKEEEE